MNISSLVIQTCPEFTEGVVDILKAADYCDYRGGEIPEWLNDENATKRDIKYNGDLKDRF